MTSHSSTANASQLRAKEHNPKPRKVVQYNVKTFLFLLIGLCLFFFIGYTNRLMVFGEEQAKVEALQEKIDKAQLETARLKSHLAFVQTDAYVEQVSRQEFGLSRQGDKMIIILPQPPTAVEDKSVVASSSSPEQLEEPFWRQWFRIFSQ